MFVRDFKSFFFKDLKQYQEGLKDGDEKDIFNRIHELLLLQGVLTNSNKYYARWFNVSVSWWEKFLQKCEDLELITRANFKSYENGHWSVVARFIKLNDKTFDYSNISSYMEKVKVFYEMVEKYKPKKDSNNEDDDDTEGDSED